MEVRIYYEDTDAGGVVYYANYLRYFERGRTEFLRDRGVSVLDLANQGCVFPVIRLEVDYRAPARHDDLLWIETTLLEVGKSSFSVRQQVLRRSDNKLLVDGRVTLACINPGLKARRLPEELLDALKK